MFFDRSITIDEEKNRGFAIAAPDDSYLPKNAFIEKLRSGDADAFDKLVVDNSPAIYGFLLRLTGDSDEAADLTQETFLSAFKAVANFRGDANIRTWLFRIAINQSRNRFRWWQRRGREKTFSMDNDNDGETASLHETLPGNSPDPESQLLAKEREAALTKALAKLPRKYREVVVLCDVEGLAYDEIADALETKIGTIKSRIARGREELRRILNGY